MDIGKIYLCKPDYTKMGVLNGVNENTAMLIRSVSDCSELTFDVQRFLGEEGKLTETDYYQSLTEWMYLFLETYDGEQYYFVIDEEPTVSSDGSQEIKSITAHSVEAELETKYLRNFKVNTGLKATSQEYLVGYYDSDGNFVNKNINSYTTLPVDYPVLHDNRAEEMQEVYNRLVVFGLSCNKKSGLITYNREAYEYLYDIYEKYPRLTQDIQDDGSMKTYLNILTNENAPLGYDVFVGHDVYTADGEVIPVAGDYSISYLLSGIQSLISYYREYGHQLSILDLALELGEASGWSIGEIPKDIAAKKYSFDVDGNDVLTFFRSIVTATCKVLVSFDILNRTVNIIDIQDEAAEQERDTGVFLSYRNLINNVSCSSSSEDGIRTEFYATGANDLGITYVNFGRDSITDLSWFMDKADVYGNRQFVSEELHDKYHRWIDFCYNTPVTIDGVSYDSRREAYRELTRLYNQNIMDTNEIVNQLPIDGLEVDYTSYSFDELNLAYKAYMNALDAVILMYRNDYGVYTFNMDTLEIWDYNGNKITDSSKNIKNTMYWWDFDAYWHYIIPNVLVALTKYVWTDGTLTLNPKDPRQMDQSTGDWIAYQGGNPWYNANPSIVKNNTNNSYKYDMSLYGTKEATLKMQAWQETAATLFRIGFVINASGKVLDYVDPESTPIYNTPDDPRAPSNAGWDLLSQAQKDNFTTQAAFERALGQYLDYVSTWVRDNSLLTPKSNLSNEAATTYVRSVGVIQLAKNRIAELQPSVDALLAKREVIDSKRDNVGTICAMDSWSEFTEEDLTTIHTLLREADYSNENILVTNLDDVVSTIDSEEELYQDAVIALSEKSRPQLSFELGTDNLFALDEFEPLREGIDLLRFIRVSIGLYDDEFMKLRIISIERNPIIQTEELTIGFSNQTYSIQGLSDLESIFGELGGTTGGGGSRGGSSGSYGDNDAEIQLSNNMLNALLKSKPYINSIGSVLMDQIVNENGYAQLMAKTGIFDSFYAGDVKISGDCLVDYVKSSNYDGGLIDMSLATEGSCINLKNGYYSFGGSNNYFDGHTLNIGKGGIVYDIDTGYMKIKADYISIAGTDAATVQDVADLKEETEEAADALSEYLSGRVDAAIEYVDEEVEDAKEYAEDQAQDAKEYAEQQAKAASDKADAAVAAANNAAKVATNYLNWTSGVGLMVAQNANNYYPGYNTLIKSGGIDFRYNSQVYARVGSVGLLVYDGNGTSDSNTLASFASTSRIGKSTGYNTVIDSNGIYLNRGSTNLFSVQSYYSNGYKADINVTGRYKINGQTVLSEDDIDNKINMALASINLSASLKVVKYVKNISAFDYDTSGTISISYISGYTAVGVVGFNLSNQSGGQNVGKTNVRCVALNGSYSVRYELNTTASSDNKAKVKLAVAVLYAEDVVGVDYPDDE